MAQKTSKWRRQAFQLELKLFRNQNSFEDCRRELQELQQEKSRRHCPHNHTVRVFSPDEQACVSRQSTCCDYVRRLGSENAVLRKDLAQTKNIARALKLWQRSQSVVESDTDQTATLLGNLRSIMPWMEKHIEALKLGRLKETINDHKRKIEAKEKEIVLLQSEKLMLKKKLAKKNAKVVRPDSTAYAKEPEVVQLKKELVQNAAPPIANSSKARVPKFCTEIEKWKAQCRDMEKAKLKQDSELESTRRELKDIKEESEGLKIKSRLNAVTTAELHEKNRVLQHRASQLEEELATARDCVKTLECGVEDLDDLQAQNAVYAILCEQNDKYMAELKGIAGTDGDLKDWLTRKNQEIQSLKSNANRVELLQQELREKDNHVAKLEAQLAGMSYVKPTNTSSITQEQVEQAESNYLWKEQQIVELQTKLEKALSDYDQLQRDGQSLIEQLNQARSENRNLHDSISIIQQEKVQLQRSNDELKDQFDRQLPNLMKEAHDQLGENFSKLKTDLETEIIEKSFEIDNLKEEKQTLQNSLEKSQKQVEQLKRIPSNTTIEEESKAKHALMNGNASNTAAICKQMAQLHNYLNTKKISVATDPVTKRVDSMYNFYVDTCNSWHYLGQQKIYQEKPNVFTRVQALVKDAKTLHQIHSMLAHYSLFWSDKRTKQFEPILSAAERVITERMKMMKDMTEIKTQLERWFVAVRADGGDATKVKNLEGKELLTEVRRLVDQCIEVRGKEKANLEREEGGKKAKRGGESSEDDEPIVLRGRKLATPRSMKNKLQE